MKWKIAAAAVAAAAIASAPLAGAKPSGTGNKPPTPPGKSISQIAKTGGGAAGVLGALRTAKPTNPGLPKALANATKPKPTPTPTPTPEPTP